jgi:HTH-type transcriptional regulator, transcriptional repressor of NAD biosynthesis genes
VKRGLVIGKFMPLHKGHIGLIEFAAQQCDELIVSLSYTDSDPIDGQLRFAWLTEVFKNNPSIKPFLVKDSFDNEALPIQERTRIWAKFLENTYPQIDYLFSSESYGDWLAKHLDAEHIIFDIDRGEFPVSASMIREKPFQHWEFIPLVVRPYFVKNICFYGPESTGKSQMTIQMAEHFTTAWVPEVAREMLINNEFTVEDIIQIGYAQYNRIQKNIRGANKFLMCDTDAITTQIYSQHYLGTIPSILFELEAKVKYEAYFLFDIDVPWVDDGLRDLGDKRKEMFGIFKSALDKRSIPYTLVRGDWDQRRRIVIDRIEKLLR